MSLWQRKDSGLAPFNEYKKLLLQRHLPGFLEQCGKFAHRIILTTDHGLSFSEKGLHHGGVGVFEQALFRAEWE